MATSGNKSITVATGLSLKFSWSRSSYSTTNNTSTIAWQMDLVSTGGNIISSAAKSWSVVVNGTKYSGSNTVGINENATKKLASGSTTIKHNADGTKTFSYSFSQQFSVNYAGSTLNTKSGSGTGTLNDIPRASTITANNAYIGNATTIKIARNSSSFKHTLQYKLPGETSFTNIVSKTSDTEYSWVLNGNLLYPLIPKAKSMEITLNCITYNSAGENIGSNTTTIKATCRESLCAPYVMPTAVDVNNKTLALTGDEYLLVRYYSKAQVHSNADARNEATVASQKITHGKTSSTVSPHIFTVNSDSFSFYVKDSRGFEINSQTAFPIINYVKLTCALDVSKPTADGKATLTVKGNYFNGSFGATNNTLTLQYRSKINDGNYSSWYTLTPTVNGNKYSLTQELTGLDYRNKYTYQVRAVDKLATVNSNEIAVKTAPVFDWSAEDFKFNVPVSFGSHMAFARSDGDNVDKLSATNGKLFFQPNSPTNTTSYKMVITPGDVVSISDNTPFAAYVSNSKKTILFSIPLNKPLVGVSSVKLSGKIEGRGITGMLYSPTTSASSYSLNDTDAETEKTTINTYITGNGIRATITFEAAIKTSETGTTTITNNTPATVVPDGTLNLTFS